MWALVPYLNLHFSLLVHCAPYSNDDVTEDLSDANEIDPKAADDMAWGSQINYLVHV